MRWQGWKSGELALHGGDEELDDESAVLGFLGDDVGEIGHIFYFMEGDGECQRGMVILGRAIPFQVVYFQPRCTPDFAGFET